MKPPNNHHNFWYPWEEFFFIPFQCSESGILPPTLPFNTCTHLYKEFFFFHYSPALPPDVTQQYNSMFYTAATFLSKLFSQYWNHDLAQRGSQTQCLREQNDNILCVSPEELWNRLGLKPLWILRLHVWTKLVLMCHTLQTWTIISLFIESN